jgi:hypothetical protein
MSEEQLELLFDYIDAAIEAHNMFDCESDIARTEARQRAINGIVFNEWD